MSNDGRSEETITSSWMRQTDRQTDDCSTNQRSTTRCVVKMYSERSSYTLNVFYDVETLRQHHPQHRHCHNCIFVISRYATISTTRTTIVYRTWRTQPNTCVVFDSGPLAPCENMRYASGQTDRQTNIHTDTMIIILHTLYRGQSK